MIDELTWRFMSTVMESENYSDLKFFNWFLIRFFFFPGVYGDIKNKASKLATNLKYLVSVSDSKH